MVKIPYLPVLLAGAVISPEKNPLNVVDRLVKELPDITASLPNGLNVDVAYNSTSFIVQLMKTYTF